MTAEAPLRHPSGQVRSDDVYSVLLDPGEVMYELAVRFRGTGEDHHDYVWRLRWVSFLEPDPMG